MTQNRQWLSKETTDKLHAYLKTDIRHSRTALPPPFFIEIVGTPSAGKTTLIDELYKFFKKRGLRVGIPQEGAQVIQHVTRDTPLYNLRTGMYALSLLVDESVGAKYDIVIFDRCLFDAYCWMEYWYEKGKLTKEEKEHHQEHFLSPFFAAHLDLVFFVTCKPDEAMRRELRVALTDEMGETTNPQTIAKLVARHEEVFARLKPRYPQLHAFDTSEMSQQEMLEAMLKLVIETFLAKINT